MSVFVVGGAYKLGRYAYRRRRAARKCKNKSGKAKKSCIRRAMKK